MSAGLNHPNITGQFVHVAHAFTYVDVAARDAAGGFATTDLHKLALQTDDHSVWVLTDTATPAWAQVGASGGGSLVQIATILVPSGGQQYLDFTSIPQLDGDLVWEGAVVSERTGAVTDSLRVSETTGGATAFYFPVSANNEIGPVPTNGVSSGGSSPGLVHLAMCNYAHRADWASANIRTLVGESLVRGIAQPTGAIGRVDQAYIAKDLLNVRFALNSGSDFAEGSRMTLYRRATA